MVYSPLKRLVVILFIPSVVYLMVTACYTLVDTFYVGRAGPFSPDNNLAFLLKPYLYENFDGLPLTWSLYGHGFVPWGMATKEGIPVIRLPCPPLHINGSHSQTLLYFKNLFFMYFSLA